MAGRYRIYKTAEDLQKAVDAYFDGISYEATAKGPTGEVYYNKNGDPVTYTAYARPPKIEGLCLSLGISYHTWERYRLQDWSRDICEEADMRIRAWRVDETSIRDRTSGLQFLLTNDSNMRAKVELELGEETRKSLSMAERKELLMDALKMMKDDLEE